MNKERNIWIFLGIRIAIGLYVYIILGILGTGGTSTLYVQWTQQWTHDK
jgi:hypothetical protein